MNAVLEIERSGGVESKMQKHLWARAILICAIGVSTNARAEAPTTDAPVSQMTSTPLVINDADPESSVPDPAVAMKRPLDMGYLMMELSDRAELAKQKNDHAQAAKYYRAIAKAVPDRAAGFARACESHQAAGQWPQALEMCRNALARGGAKAEDYIRFVRVALHKSGALSPTEIEDVEAAITQLRTGAATDQGRRIAAELDCELSTRLQDATRMTACIATLKQLGESEAKVIAYQWALAVLQKDTKRAQELAARAKQMGLPQSVVDSMEAGLGGTIAGNDQNTPPSSGGSGSSGLPSWLPLVAMAALAIAAAALVLARRGRSRSA